ncbi:DUF4270 domain-containing protein [Changchengzhania lutea]|uniref:DUF4270 domain-containing protein n=1 Tax=Changchengzhania lutea TaxID=2049305 RepID=UPI00115DCD3B|nr:DUF4270 domain-containing protein [Changchengzhania lutea]
MKKIFKALKFSSLFSLIVILFVGCDKDFNILESDVLGRDNANFNTGFNKLPVLAYNKKLDSVQINGLSANLLGVYNDPSYGLTKASIITQVTPTTFGVDFGVNPIIKSVTLHIPYFSRAIDVDGDGNLTYTIQDSLFGNPEAFIKLSIYQNNYFLRDFNPNSSTNEAQNYYSNAESGINMTDNFALTDNALINFDEQKGALVYNDDNFIPSADAIITITGEGETAVTTRSAPALKVELNKDFWTNLLFLDATEADLSNSNNFKNYFRGLYFKAENIGNDGNMVLLNLASNEANITINYINDASTDDDTETYTLNFSGNRLNTFINDFSSVILENGDKDLGDLQLYLKGTAGSMAVVDLFGNEDLNDNDIPDGLEDFISDYRKTDKDGKFITEPTTGNFKLKRLINEAQLVIYEDVTSLPSDEDYHKYDRIYAYDIANELPTVDYFIDPVENSQEPYNSKVISLGQRIIEDDVPKYKIRLTEHLNNILLKDSTNTKLGLVISNNVNLINNAEILDSEDAVKSIPSVSIISPRGTILYGTHSTVDEKKRMAFEIFYTEPKEN